MSSILMVNNSSISLRLLLRLRLLPLASEHHVVHQYHSPRPVPLLAALRCRAEAMGGGGDRTRGRVGASKELKESD